jgi:sigma-54 dependent transcriptional regulator, acetoin dehydrogenase operon transcriptional activator AcoR
LKAIKTFVQEIIETMSTVLEVEITVVDRDLERIAGTGIFRSQIGEHIPNSYILNKVIQTGQHHIIEDPGKNELCKGCQYYHRCSETAVIDLPIVLENNIIGAMALVSFDEVTRKRLLQKKNSLLLFIKDFSKLITSKVIEEKLIKESLFMAEELKSVLNAINEGIIAINKDGNINLVNSYVKRKMDSFSENDLLGKPIFQFIPELAIGKGLNSFQTVNYQKGYIKIKKSIFQIIYSFIPIRISDEVKGAILVFQIFEDANKITHKINEARNLVMFNDLLGTSKIFHETKLKAQLAAKNDSTIFLLGESGTGKELFSKAIHSASKRNKGPFVVINCAAIPDSLLESELFGYERGAFTDARKEGKLGKFEQADKGTLVLDEIGDMNMAMQPKLLRVLEDKYIERIGSTKLKRIDVRLIASTSKNIEEMVERGNFRSDLYYRISTIPIVLPPLRQRKEDIFLYLDFFRRHFNSVLEKEIKGIANEAGKILKEYYWPGNIRELKNVMEYAMNMENEIYIKVESLPDRIRDNTNARNNSTLSSKEKKESQAILENLEKYGKTTKGKKLVAKEMNVSLASLYRKIKKYNIL